MSFEQLLAKQKEVSSGLESELKKAKAELTSTQQKMEQVLKEGLNKEELLAKEAAAQLEAEREKRIEQIGSQGMRRIMQKELAAGWQGWHDMYTAAVRKRNLLKAAGARLSKPKLTAAFKQWFHDWDDVEKERLALGYKKLQSEQGSKQAKLEKEVDSLRNELAAAQKQIAEGTSSKDALAEQMAAQLEDERDKRIEQIGSQGMRRIMQKELASGWQSWHD
eukprot:2509067-Prymnesium_polylepis.1